MVLKRGKNDNKTLFIDASNRFVHEGNKNKLSLDDIKAILDEFIERKEIKYFSALVESRQEYVKAEIDKVKAQTMNLVHQAQEAAEAAKTEKAKAEEAQALAQLEQAKAEAQAEAIRQEAEAAQMEKQRAEQARILAEQERAKVEAETGAFKQRTRAEAYARCAELEGQLAQAQAYINEQEGIIASTAALDASPKFSSP